MPPPFAFLNNGNFPANINRNKFISLSKFVLMSQGSTIRDGKLNRLFQRLLKQYKTGKTLPKAILAKHVSPNCGSSRCWMGLPIGRVLHGDHTIHVTSSERHDHPLHVSAGATLTVHGNLVSDAITVAGTLIVHGAHEHKSLTILETGHYHVHGNSASSTTKARTEIDTDTTNKIPVTNKGTFTVDKNATYTNNSVFTNNNIVNIFGTFVNKGLTLNNDTVTVESSGTFTNNSQYQNTKSDSTTVINGTFNNNDYSYLAGTVTVGLKAKIVNISSLGITGTMNMFGTLTSTDLINVDGELNIKGVVENSATINISGTITGSGRLSSTGVMNVYGELTMVGYVENGGSISNTGTIIGYVENGGSISNSGTITVSGSLVNLTSTTSIINNGIIIINKSLVNFGTMTNTGQLIINVGQFHNGGTFNNIYNEDTQIYGTTLVKWSCLMYNHNSYYTHGTTEYTYTYISPISKQTYGSYDGEINIRSGAAVGTDETKDQTFKTQSVLYNFSTINIYHRGKMYIDGENLNHGQFLNYSGVNRVSDGMVLINGGTNAREGFVNIWSGKAI